MSAYTLTILVSFTGRKIRSLLYSSPLLSSFLSDRERKAMLSLYVSAAVSILYAFLKAVSGYTGHDPFQIFGAVYFALTAIIRLHLIRQRGKNDENAASRKAAVTMLFLNIALIGMTIHAVLWHEGARYSGYMIYAAALYTFYILIIATKNMFIYRRSSSPVIITSKSITLSAAFFSLFSLQTAMFSSFGGGEGFQTLMNAATGSAVSAINTIIAISLILRNRKKS